MILDTIAESTRKRVEHAKTCIPFNTMKNRAMALAADASDYDRGFSFPFETALAAPGMSFICEVKKASPSKGLIAADFPYAEIAREYEQAGAAAISVLTEPEFFQGSNRYLTEIQRTVSTPVLRKDFTIDEYQIYEARLIGASAVLLICALLDMETIARYIRICDKMGLSALVEAHTKEEIISAVKAGARVIGVNNRNLKTFEVDFENSIRLRSLVPDSIVFVAESGIRTPQDILRLSKAGVNAVLVGETLMRAADKREELNRLRILEDTYEPVS